jgi:geranylgeranyl pyrophosphate synthase
MRSRAPIITTLLVALVGGASGWAAQPHFRQQHRRAEASMSLQATPITRLGLVPPGPDPYKLVRDDIELIKSSIKKMLSTNKGTGASLAQNEVLTMAAREFTARQGKSFRPMLVLLVGRATNPDFVISKRHFKLAVIAEMIHTASLIHGDVLEENADPSEEEKGTVVHQEVALDVGNKVCILAGDFLLSKSAVELALLDDDDVTELIARGLEAICEGGMLASDVDDAMLEGKGLEAYLAASALNNADLISECCHSASILSGHLVDDLTAQACRNFGKDLATAQQLVGEAEQAELLIKASRTRQVKWPEAVAQHSAPIMYACDHYPELRPVVLDGQRSKACVATTVELLERSNAVEHTLAMAAERAQAAAESLELLPTSAARDALVVLCHRVLSSTPIK